MHSTSKMHEKVFASDVATMLLLAAASDKTLLLLMLLSSGNV